MGASRNSVEPAAFGYADIATTGRYVRNRQCRGEGHRTQAEKLI